VLAQRQEGGALGLFLRRELFPLRAADGAEEDGVGLGESLSVESGRALPWLSIPAPPTSAVV